MKRQTPWSDEEDDSSSSSGSDSESAAADKKSSRQRKSKGKSRKLRSGGDVDFEALRQHGYKGGLSVLSVPAPKDDTKPDWTWSTGKERPETTDVEESYQERQKTRYALRDGEALMNVQTSKEKKNMSFQQKEKRKRELGQASRGKNYVEEEKRLLRESGVYSGFDA